MRFSEYYEKLTMRQKENLAKNLNSSTAYLYQIATGRRNAGKKYILNIASFTKNKVKGHEI